MNCLKCGKETSNPKFCSRSCAVSVTNIGKERSLDKNKFKYVRKDCLNCSNKLTRGKGRTFCSKLCESEYKKNIKYKKIEQEPNSFKSAPVKKYLIEKHGEKCMDCGWDKRNPVTNKVPIEIEHLDGNSNNNELSNLKLLCPNCHSLSPTYRALNKGNGRHKRRERYNSGKSF
jgi:hypothetical protein